MNKEENKKWKEENSLDYPVLDDSIGMVGIQFDAKTTLHMFILDTGQKSVKYNGAIDDDPRGSQNQSERKNHVDSALDEIKSGKSVSVSETKPYGCSVKYK